MEKQLSYTKEEMINLLMLFEEEYAEEYKDDIDGYMSGKTPKEWLDSQFKEYIGVSNDTLKKYFRELTGFNAEIKDDFKHYYYYYQNMKRLEERKGKLWIE